MTDIGDAVLPSEEHLAYIAAHTSTVAYRDIQFWRIFMQQMKTKTGHAMHMDSAMQQCIESCQTCHTVCLQHATQHCLEASGDHVAPAHFRLMLACAQICQTSADFMLMNAELHAQLCGVCAQVCDACAKSCAELDDMQACVEACQQCATSCREMANM